MVLKKSLDYITALMILTDLDRWDARATIIFLTDLSPTPSRFGIVTDVEKDKFLEVSHVLVPRGWDWDPALKHLCTYHLI